ncbi:SDR family NAD(P)-dependent oxidoreductase [Bacteroides caecigallinarum]|uniref:SDR family NAD(P)-dependent oxidoreductase n=1 Tax=Bacteroides caecigallinarum TaxID=1411144 RepID=UPI0019583DC3|nr:SDR family NAD(P)-dependent oxidoreductase [Bacteroides caecigallinarum]MBM6891291.1 SDR family NAD(P)-dependent oxidoreductase [Bacteroides caecigallinarum]MCF2551665.1 SDR family NAD(P)-dependent oxidoreductase [Bacteroides caecigallinarum]
MTNNTKRAVIMGATSGLGYEVALLLLSDGWKLGLAGRREENLRELQSEFPEQVCIKAIDVKDSNSDKALLALIDELGGMDIYFHSSGIGYQNAKLDADIELNTLETNGTGFTRLVGTAFRYFKKKGKGHIAVISSIAGTKGLGVAPAYSATKRFQNTYIDALEQLAGMQKLNIRFTDIRPGFVATSLLNDGKNYPMLMKTPYAAKLIVKAVRKHKRVAVIDWKYSILVFFWKLIPRCTWKRMKVKN